MKLGLRVGEPVTDSFSGDTVVQPSIIQEQNYVLFYVLGRQWVKSKSMESARQGDQGRWCFTASGLVT